MQIPRGEVKPTTEESAETAGETPVTSITRTKAMNSAIQSSDRRQKITRLTAIQNGEMSVTSAMLSVA